MTDQELYENAVQLLGEKRVEEIIIASRLPDPDARNELVVRNLWVVDYAMKQLRISDIYIDDMRSVGVLALYHAADKFDPTIGKFSTYAIHWVRQKIHRALSKELAELFSVPTRRYVTRKKTGEPMIYRQSLSDRVYANDPDAVSFEEMLADEKVVHSDDRVAAIECLQALCEACGSLGDDAYRPVLPWAIGATDETLAEIGDRQGVSREAIRLRSKWLIRLAKHFLNLNGNAYNPRKRRTRKKEGYAHRSTKDGRESGQKQRRLLSASSKTTDDNRPGKCSNSRSPI